MKESVAIAKEANTKKESSPTRSDNSIQRLRNEPERQLGSLRDVIGNIRRNGGTPSIENISTELSVMPSSDCASALLALQQTHGNQYVQRVVTGIQAKLKVGQPRDKYEQEADRMADLVMRMIEPQVPRQVEEEEKEEETLQTKPLAAQITPLVQRQVNLEEEEEIRPKVIVGAAPEVTLEMERDIRSITGVGQPLSMSERAFFEPRFGADFSNVRVHSDARAAHAVRSVNARAFTLERDVVFGGGEYSSGTRSGRKLLAHELTHIIQQGGARADLEQSHAFSPVGQPHIQRTLGDGHDLTSPRFSRLLDLEEAYDGETVICKGSSGRGVQAIQQALYDIGYSLPAYGADGEFGRETKAAVVAFQRANPPLAGDGKVGELTMAALDARFSGAPVLPAPVVLSAPWTDTCVRSVLCPWSPHTIDVLRTRITLKSYDSLSWADEEWDGAAWIPAPFPGGGYNTGTEIGVLNSSCESMSETLYHEVLHAEQPTTHRTTRERESYAYRIGEEFSIAMGLGGQPSLRSTDIQGREYADPAKVGAFVATYPSVPAGGGRDEIIGKAITYGHVRVQRPNGTIYTRPAAVGEKVEGPMSVVNEVPHPTGGWSCP
ncbi:Peptidoglycan-binding (PGRP) domain of peptidoglycan hydrolases-containing protein [Candidatus Methanophagaceae archaeon]|nr:Peptidoglycan-binding (PGRP) domain of peptidoglycan hydrolases-containing protein [Methanophagales archaeon]